MPPDPPALPGTIIRLSLKTREWSLTGPSVHTLVAADLPKVGIMFEKQAQELLAAVISLEDYQ